MLCMLQQAHACHQEHVSHPCSQIAGQDALLLLWRLASTLAGKNPQSGWDNEQAGPVALQAEAHAKEELEKQLAAGQTQSAERCAEPQQHQEAEPLPSAAAFEAADQQAAAMSSTPSESLPPMVACMCAAVEEALRLLVCALPDTIHLLQVLRPSIPVRDASAARAMS